MLVGKPILAGVSDGHQLDIIWDLCGSPTDDNMPGWKSLPGAEGLQPRVRPENLSTRFSKYVFGADVEEAKCTNHVQAQKKRHKTNGNIDSDRLQYLS